MSFRGKVEGKKKRRGLKRSRGVADPASNLEKDRGGRETSEMRSKIGLRSKYGGERWFGK